MSGRDDLALPSPDPIRREDFTPQGIKRIGEIVREVIAAEYATVAVPVDRLLVQVQHTQDTQVHYAVSRSSSKDGGVGVVVSVTGTNLEDMRNKFGEGMDEAFKRAGRFRQ